MQNIQDEYDDDASIAPLPNFIPPDAPMPKVAEQAQKEAEMALAAVVEELELIVPALTDNSEIAPPAQMNATNEQPSAEIEDTLKPVEDLVVSADATIEMVAEKATSQPPIEPGDAIQNVASEEASTSSVESVLNELATEINSAHAGMGALKNDSDRNKPQKIAGSEAVESSDKIELDRDTYLTLMDVARKVNSGAVLVDPTELQRVNNVVGRGTAPVVGAQPFDGTPLKVGGASAANGVASLIGGIGSVAGGVMSVGGQGLSKIGSATSKLVNDAVGKSKSEALETVVPPTEVGTEFDRKSVGVAVLPRLSEYRVEQAEKASNAYGNALRALWESGDLPNVRHELEERARTTGLSVEDVMEKMRPNGEMADLHKKFISAVANSPDAQSQKKAMDKALDGWSRQYGRGQEEILNPETDGNPYLEGLRERLDKSGDKMQKNTALVPAFEDEDKSHAEKMRERIAKIAEKIKEIVKDFVDLVRGKSSGAESSNAPSP